MIKEVKTIEDVLAVVDICPSMANAPLFDKEGYGLLPKGDDILGTFYDEVEKDVFILWMVYAERNDMTFIMKRSLIKFVDEDKEVQKEDVYEWHWGSPEDRETEISYLTMEKKTKYNIEKIHSFYTGGNIYCFFGKVGNYWFDVSDAFEEVCILDASPFDEDGEVTISAWQRELEDEHLVKYLEGKDADEFKVQMYRWILDHQDDEDAVGGISIENIECDLKNLLSK